MFPSSHLPPNEIDERTRTVYMVRESFSMYSEISNTTLRRIVESAFRIIRCMSTPPYSDPYITLLPLRSELIAESQSRRCATQASTFNLATQHQPSTKPAPFSEVLRRISRNMTPGNQSSRVDGPRVASSMTSQMHPHPYQQPSSASGKIYEQPPPQEFMFRVL